jgi:hypothetical protein
MQDPTKDKNLAVVAFNGIPRGACSDFNVEEGWIEYLTPKTGKYNDYSNPDVPLERRRYHGKVEVLTYIDLKCPDDQLMKFYENLPPATSMIPTESYEVVG